MSPRRASPASGSSAWTRPAGLRCVARGGHSICRTSTRRWRQTGAEMRSNIAAAGHTPVRPVYASKEGTMEHFLTARYCLYAGDARGRLWRGEIHHPPWPLQRAEAEISLNTVTAQIGLILPQTQPLLHFARQLKVLAWALRQLEQP